jgi:hypothetical protein
MAPPSEFDLRAALADGEGDSPDPEALISAGRARRVQRRNRFLTTAAVVALVAGGAVGVSQLDSSHSGGNGGTADAVANGGMGALPHSAVGSKGARYAPLARRGSFDTAASAPVNGSVQSLARLPCPAASTAYGLGEPGTTSAQARGPLFSADVYSAVVCAYGATADVVLAPAQHPARLELVGSAATRLAVSMERAERAPNTRPCGHGVPNRYTVTGVGDSGKRLNTVAVDLIGTACAPVLTNGRAVRYNWVPPPDLARRLGVLSPIAIPASPKASPSR